MPHKWQQTHSVMRFRLQSVIQQRDQVCSHHKVMWLKLTFWWPWFRYPLRLGPGFDFCNTVIEPGAVRGHCVVCLGGEEKVWIWYFSVYISSWKEAQHLAKLAHLPKLKWWTYIRQSTNKCSTTQQSVDYVLPGPTRDWWHWPSLHNCIEI